MEKELYFSKKLSNIAGLQEAAQIDYFLCSENDVFGIEITEDSYGSEFIGCSFKTKSEAENFIFYIYENSVYPGNAAEIINDLRGKHD